MVLGIENYMWELLPEYGKTALNLIMLFVVTPILLGLFWQVSAIIPCSIWLFCANITSFTKAATRASALWYTILEKFLGAAFVVAAAFLILVLPVNWTAVYIYAGWYILQLVLYVVLPGKMYEGLPLKDENGRKLKYKCNGLLAFIISIALFFYGDRIIPGWHMSILAGEFFLRLTINLFI